MDTQFILTLLRNFNNGIGFEMVNTLISKIVIEHKKKENGVKTQEINIVWRFVEMSFQELLNIVAFLC